MNKGKRGRKWKALNWKPGQIRGGTSKSEEGLVSTVRWEAWHWSRQMTRRLSGIHVLPFLLHVHRQNACTNTSVPIYTIFESNFNITLRNFTHFYLDVHESVHRDTIMKVTNKMQLYGLIYFSLSALHVSGDVFAHHQKHFTVFTVSGSIHPGCCRLVSWIVWTHGLTHPRQQPAATWVNTTRYCKYSQVLLMMGENIARNM